MKTRTIIGIILVALFTTILITTQLSDQSYYTDFETARKTGDKVHVVATWVDREKAFYDPEKDLFQLYLIRSHSYIITTLNLPVSKRLRKS